MVLIKVNIQDMHLVLSFSYSYLIGISVYFPRMNINNFKMFMETVLRKTQYPKRCLLLQ